VLSCQSPPRSVRTPRSFNAAAMARNVVAPAACIWRTIGRTLAAKASAASRLAATPLACASGRLVRFPRMAPCAFFCASAALVRSAINARAAGQHRALRFALTRRRIDDAGGFLGIERMSNGRTILAGAGVGGMLVVVILPAV
jgi:hypothetical protein